MDRDLQRIYGKVARVIDDNASLILTALSIGGVAITAISAAKATPKAIELLEDADSIKDGDLTIKEKVIVAGRCYVPTVIFGVSTAACILGNYYLTKEQQAALTSAYILLENSYNDYRDKVKELYGEETDQEIRASIVKDKYDEEFSDEDRRYGEIQLYFDEFSNRFFEARPLEVQWAQYELNRLFILQGYAMLNDYYRLLGIPEIPSGYEVGWEGYVGETTYGYSWIDFTEESLPMDDGIECIAISMPFPPTPDYNEEFM